MTIVDKSRKELPFVKLDIDPKQSKTLYLKYQPKNDHKEKSTLKIFFENAFHNEKSRGILDKTSIAKPIAKIQITYDIQIFPINIHIFDTKTGKLSNFKYNLTKEIYLLDDRSLKCDEIKLQSEKYLKNIQVKCLHDCCNLL